MSEDRARRIFQDALERPAEERAAFLDGACGGPGPLRARVDALLAAHARMGEFLVCPAAEDEDPEGPGARIDRYKILQRIGEGGFGVVYMAEQTEPVRRKVALKVIKLGMDTKQVVARFEAERQALALMDHPHIARVLDGGATANGRPYFVMELVKGVPITEYCDEARLDTRARLALFTRVCDAVQHAHGKGIIHRDLKPSNVLVTLHDGEPVPRVIDFGIAKALDRELTEKTLFTEFRQMIGTPEYMAPEQAEMSGLGVDTRSDVYSLGVLLYELLTGTKPFDLGGRGYEEMLRTIRETDPPRPSTRISTMGEELKAVARKRHTPAAVLGRLVRGDLDWIVMKALEKSRARRYEAADELAADIARFLRDEPVLASPPSAAYRARKLVRRHRAGVAAAAVVLVATVASTGLAYAGKRRAESEAHAAERAAAELRDRRRAAVTARAAEAEQRRRAEAGTAEAEREAERAAAVASLIDGLFGSAAPSRDRVTVRDLLDDFERGLGDAARQPEILAEVRQLLGSAYLGLGFPARAAAHLDELRAYRAERAEEEPRDYADALHLGARLLHDRGDYAGAENMARRALAIRREVFGEAHPFVAITRGMLADLRLHQADAEEAERLARTSLATLRSAYGDGHKDVVVAMNMLGKALHRRGDLDGAEEVLRRAGPAAAGTLGHVLSLKAEYSEAERLVRNRLARATAKFGDGHPDVATATLSLAQVLKLRARFDEAGVLLRRALSIYRDTLGEDHVDVATTLCEIGSVLYEKGELAAAATACREAIAAHRRHGRPADAALSVLGTVLLGTGDLDGAEAAFAEVLAAARAANAPTKDTATALHNIARVRARRGDHAGAETAQREALAIYRKVLGDGHPLVATGLNNLAMWSRSKKKAKAALLLLEEALAIQRGVHGERHPDVAATLNNLAAVLLDMGDLAGAIARQREAVAAHRSAATLSNLAAMLARHGDRAGAADAYRACLEILLETHPESDREVVSTRVRLVGLLLSEKDYGGAVPVLRDLARQEDSHTVLAALGMCLLETGAPAEAERVLRTCVARREKEVPGSWLLYNAKSLLGASLAGQGRYADAEPLLLEACEKMAPPDQHAHRKREARARLIALYEAWGRPERAEEWRDR